jgi:hypothetical protein
MALQRIRWVGIVAVLVIISALTSVLVALSHGDPTPAPGGEAAASGTLDFVPTYYEHIAPILETNCTSCHVEGEFGHDVFEMDTPEEIAAGAEDIALVVSTNYMPPWPPSEASQHFLYDRSLTQEQILEIVTWAENEAPLGDPSVEPVSVPTHSEPVIESDLVLTMPEPYTPNQELSDDYRCFLLDPGFTEPTYIVGYDIIPNNRGAVHHTVLFPGAPSQRAEADALNGADGQPGWQCFGGSGLSSGGPDMGMLRPLLPIFAEVGGLGRMRQLLQSEDAAAQLDAAIAAIDTDGSLTARIEAIGGTERLVPLLSQGLLASEGVSDMPVAGVIGAWVPGSTPSQFPVNTGLLIPAGGFVIMQMHYNTQANTDPDQSQLILDTATDEGIAAARVLAINGAVEIPCPEGVTGEACDRANTNFEGSDLVMAICGQTLADFALQDPANAISTCEDVVTTSGWALSIMSHQHKLGQSTNTVLNPDTPEARVLIDIPVWDFDWQGNYWFAEPIWLNEGDVIRVTCVYDNSVSRSNPEPRYVVTGEGTNDEMCLNFITILPAEPGSPPPVMAGGE